MRWVPTVLLACLTLAGCTSGPPTPDGGSGTASPTATGPDAAAAVAAAVAPGPYDTTEASYRLDDLRLGDLPEPVEVEGHVVGPVGASGPLPLVVLLHGYTASCWDPADGSSTTDWPCPEGFEPIPNWRGFDYLQQRLASQGYLTVSLAANGVNVMATEMGEDAGAQARADLVHHHLDAWAAGEVPAVQTWPEVDASRVLLVGHSRGGEGVDRAARERPADADWSVSGEVLIAPTAFEPGDRGAAPLVTLTGYCDGDVGPGPAQRYVDRESDPDLLRSAVIVEGANHNYFNAEWVPGESTVPGAYDDAFLEGGEVDPMCAPDSPTRLTGAEQQDVAARVLGLAAAAFLKGDPAAADVLDGRVAVPLEGDAQVWVSALGRDRRTLRYGEGFTGSGEGSVAVETCDGVSETEDPGDCGAFTGEGSSVHWPAAYRKPEVREYPLLTWSQAGGAADLALTEPLDLGAAAGLEARVAVAPEESPVQFDVVLEDAAGQTATLATEPIEAFPQGQLLPSRRWGQRLYADLAGVDGLDLTEVTRVSLVPRTAGGKVWIIDLSAVPQTPATS